MDACCPFKVIFKMFQGIGPVVLWVETFFSPPPSCPFLSAKTAAWGAAVLALEKRLRMGKQACFSPLHCGPHGILKSL